MWLAGAQVAASFSLLLPQEQYQGDGLEPEQQEPESALTWEVGGAACVLTPPCPFGANP